MCDQILHTQWYDTMFILYESDGFQCVGILTRQMGSQIKHSIFQESTELAIHGWHEKVKEKRKKRKLNHRPVSSSIHKTFGLSSKLKHHNSTPRSVRLSKGHATKSTPMDQVNTGLHDTQDIVQSDNSKLSGKNSISFLCNNTYSMKKRIACFN